VKLITYFFLLHIKLYIPAKIHELILKDSRIRAFARPITANIYAYRSLDAWAWELEIGWQAPRTPPQASITRTVRLPSYPRSL